MDSPKGSGARSFDWRFKRFSIPRSTTDTTSSVYFNGEGDPSQYTFYREPTPPPPPLTPLHREKTASGTWTATGTYASTGPDLPGGQRALLVDGKGKNGVGLVCGPRRRVFWIAVLALAAIVIGLAVGLGVGIGASKKASSPAESHASSSSAAASATATTSPSSSASPPASSTSVPSSTFGPSSTSSASSSSETTSFKSDCPAKNDTFYVPEDYNKRFHRICGIDFSGDGQATDIAHLLTANMTECMDSCARVTDCTGCSWGFIKGDQGGTHRCWLKKDLGKSHLADSEWCFARLL